MREVLHPHHLDGLDHPRQGGQLQQQCPISCPSQRSLLKTSKKFRGKIVDVWGTVPAEQLTVNS
jgi:hypothetical protein